MILEMLTQFAVICSKLNCHSSHRKSTVCFKTQLWKSRKNEEKLSNPGTKIPPQATKCAKNNNIALANYGERQTNARDKRVLCKAKPVTTKSRTASLRAAWLQKKQGNCLCWSVVTLLLYDPFTVIHEDV